MWRISAVALVFALSWADAASAALKKYAVRRDNIVYTGDTSPTSFRQPSNEEGSVGVALVDDALATAVMRKLTVVTDANVTVQVPQLSGFVYVSRKWTDSPTPNQDAQAPGSTSDVIHWGTLTGWASSGRHWCNSEPGTLCVILGIPDEGTGSTPIPSPFYDIGTWFFHGTGFTSSPWVYTRFTTGAQGANQQYVLRGALTPDGTVPGLPLLGLTLLGSSVVFAGVSALRRRR